MPIIWQFDIRPGAEAFERKAPMGLDKLSRRGRSFLGSSFLRDIGTVRYCSSMREMVVYEAPSDFGDELQELEREREQLVTHGNIGVFTALDVRNRQPHLVRRSGK